MKKVLSLVLVIAMVLSSMSFAFASTGLSDIADSDYKKAIETLNALGIITGYEDGTFRPEKTITRAEVATILVKALGYENLVAGASNVFPDTANHWAKGYASVASGTGLVIGYPDGSFRPDSIVTYDEVLTMVIRALGYKDSVLSGTWPTNYKVKAIDLDITDDVTMSKPQADRGGVAKIFYNTLEDKMVEIDEDGIAVPKSPEKLFIDNVATPAKEYYVDSDKIDPESKNYASEIIDLTPYTYQEISVYLNDDDQVVYVKGTNVLTFTGTVTDITEDEITVENADEDEYTFATTGSGIDFLYNGEEVKSYDYSKLVKDEAEVTVVLDAEDDDKLKDDIEVTGIVANQVSGYVQVEDEYVKDELTLDVIYLPEDDDKVDLDNLKIQGDATSLEDIKENDVLSVYAPLDDGSDAYFDKEAASKLTIIVARDVVEGKVTKVNSDLEAYINGTAYEQNGLTLKAGDEGTFYLDHKGKIFAFDEEGSAGVGNYALVLSKTNGYQSAATDGVVLADPKVKLLTASGEEITYVLDYEDLATSVVAESDKDIVVKLTKGNLVKYDLNSDEEIDELEVVSKGSEATIKTNVNSFNLSTNAVIFNVPEDNYDDAEVITADDLDEKSVTGYKVVDGDEIIVLIVTDGAVGQSGIYAIITDDAGKAYDEDEEKEVKLYTAYVNGEEVEYLEHKDASTITASNDVVKLTLSNGKLKAAAVVTGSAVKAGVASNNRVSGSITATDESVYFLASDVVVYVVDEDGDVSVGAKSDIRNNEFKVYDTVDNDEDYDIVVVFEK